MVKTRQIDLLISSLPGIGASDLEQLERVRSLEEQLRQADKDIIECSKRRERLLEKCDTVILELSRKKTEINKSTTTN